MLKTRRAFNGLWMCVFYIFFLVFLSYSAPRHQHILFVVASYLRSIWKTAIAVLPLSHDRFNILGCPSLALFTFTSILHRMCALRVCVRARCDADTDPGNRILLRALDSVYWARIPNCCCRLPAVTYRSSFHSFFTSGEHSKFSESVFAVYFVRYSLLVRLGCAFSVSYSIQ